MKTPRRDTPILDAANELDLSEETVRRDIKRQAPFSKIKGKFFCNVPEYRQWRESQGLSGERGRPSFANDSPDLEAARLRKENALASKYELQVERERGELLPVEDVKQFVGEAVSVFRNNWAGFGAAVVPHLQGRDAAEQQGILETRIEELFSGLAKTLADRFGCKQVA